MSVDAVERLGKWKRVGVGVSWSRLLLLGLGGGTRVGDLEQGKGRSTTEEHNKVQGRGIISYWLLFRNG